MVSAKDLDPAASPMHFFGAEVRRARLAAGMTLADLGARVPCDASTVSRIEGGTLSPTERFAEACDEAFPHMDGWFSRFYHDSRKWNGPYPAWFRPFVEYEARAKSLRTFEHSLVPGQLQTADYARAVLATRPNIAHDEIEQLTTARLDRQVILERESPPLLWAVIDESVLHREVGGSKVMRDQLWHIADASDRPNITVEVIPYGTGAHSGLLGAFVIADFADAPSIVYLETSNGGTIVEKPSAVEEEALIFDSLRSDALPRRQSRNLIMKVAEDVWT
jgi:transcriptional regulator with XRE-family HTH domain